MGRGWGSASITLDSNLGSSLSHPSGFPTAHSTVLVYGWMLCTRVAAAARHLVRKPPSAAKIWLAPLSCSIQAKRPLSTAAREMALPLPKDPLVWIDCEMTGLDLSKDRLLEIAVRSCRSIFGRNPG